MKSNYFLILLLSFVNYGFCSNFSAAFLPTATISGGTTVCQNTPNVVVTFTGSGGVAPYTFIYKINGGLDETVITTTGNSVTLPVITTTASTFIYTLISVKESTGPFVPVSGTTTFTINAPPVVDFTFTNNVCSGTAVAFNSAVTGGNGLTTYLWDFGDGTPDSTAANPSHTFTSLGCGIQNFTVKLTVTKGGCTVLKTYNLSVKQSPNVDFTDLDSPFNLFNNCDDAATNPVYTINVGLSIASSCVSSYSINWGDGNTENNVTFPKSHTYSQVGAYSMLISALGTNGCTTTKNYVIKNVSNPLGGLNSPGSTQNLCAPTSNLQFSISNWGSNSLDTTYNIDYGDGTTLVLSQATLIASTYYNTANPAGSANFPIPHIYTTSSCPLPSFELKLFVTNACGTTPFTLGNISILTKANADFTVPSAACVGVGVLFTNTTSLGFGLNCNSNAIYSWNFGDGSPIVTTSPSAAQNISHTYTTAGTFNVTLTVLGYCGTTTISKPICVQPQLIPNFTLNNITGCTPLAVTATNTTNITNQCDTPTYNWIVTYAAGNCGTTSGFTYTNGTSATSASPTFNFTGPGIYTLSLQTTNSCGTVTSVIQTVNVKKPPTVSIASIADACGSTTISPIATVANCTPTSSSLTYAWSFVGGNPATANTLNPGTITYSSPGTYNVSLTVTNECGVSNTAVDTFIINPSPTITNTNLSQTICSGAATLPVSFITNPSGATFSWTATATAGISGFTPSGTTATIPSQTISTTNASAGTVTYIVTPKIGNCTGTPVNYIVNVIPAPVITTQPTSSILCLNGVATALTVVINTSSGTPSYQWYSNSNNSTLGGTLITSATSATYVPPTSSTGTIYYYCIISLPSGGCSNLTSNLASVQVVPIPSISTQPLASQNLCVGVTIANPLSVSYINGTGTVSYQWYFNTTNATTGGTLISGATSATYTPGIFSTAGIYYYYVTVTFSGNNCGIVTSEIAQITVFTDPILSTQPVGIQTLCQGATPQNLEVVASGGNGTFTYQWYSNLLNNTSGAVISGATNSIFIPPTSAVGTLYYYCIVSQSTMGCGVTSSIAKVVVNQSPTVVNQPVSSTVCLGGNPTTLTFTVTNGAGTPTYQWFSNTVNNTTTGVTIVGATNATFTPPAAAVGTLYYYCLINFPAISGSCATIATNTATVDVTTAAQINQNPIPNQTLCVGTTVTNPLTVSYSGGTGTPSYQWFSNSNNSNSGGTAISGATSSSFIPAVFTSVGTYFYYVNITFAGSGCGFISSAVAAIDIIADPVISLQPENMQTLCQNAVPTTLSVTASGGGGINYNYQWYSSTTNATSGGTLIPGATNASFVPSTATVGTVYYYCFVSQAIGSGCEVSSNTAAVIINPSPTIDEQPLSNSWCINQTPLNLSVNYTNGTGTPLYQWYSNTSDSNTSGILINGATNATYVPQTITAGISYYYCIISFPDLSGGCEIITSNTALISVNPFPVIAAETETICSNTSFSITPLTGNGNLIPAGTTYTWTLPTVVPAGAVSGFSGVSIAQTVISQNLVNNTTNPATVTYTVTPTSGVCAGAPFTVTITVNPAIDPNIMVVNNDCFGSNNASITTNISGGIPPYSITWNGPAGFTSSATTISNLEPGTYTILIEDVGNCPFTNMYTITQPDDIVISINNQNNSSCFQSNNGSIDIQVSGGTGAYFYTWTKDNLPYATTQDLANLIPGQYVVSVTDANNCGPKTLSFTVTEPPLLVVSLLNQTNINCFGAATGVINTDVVGGTVVSNYNFAWSGPGGFTSSNQNLSGLFAGIYNLVVTDDNGCQKTLEVTLTQSSPIILTYTTTEITCYGANDASFSASISGGNALYQFTWSNLSTALNQNNLSAGDYTITITDNLGCIKIETINIPEAPIFTVNPIVNNVTCFGANNGSIQLNLTGGIAPVALTWSDGSTAGLTRNNLSPGIYTATISDGTPCFIVRTFTIVEPQLLVASANTTNPTDCTNASTGVVDLIVSGGTPPFTYSWSNGATTEDLNNLVAGNYAVVITDLNGCTVSAQYNLIRPEPLKIDITTQTDFNCDLREVTQNFVAQASGGVPPYHYQWSSGIVSGANGEIMTTDLNGTVILTVIDNLGCTHNYTVNVDNIEIGAISFETNSTGFVSFGTYSIEDPIQFTSNITGDFESVYWDFGDGTNSVEENPLHTYSIPKDYVVKLTVTYPFGCVYQYFVTLTVEKGYILVLPTAFTPNSDSVNDAFRPVTKNLKNITFDIYDSWGSIIYSEKGDVIKGWDAKIKGFNAENGNYYGKVSAETFYGTIVYDQQTFVLIK